MYLLVTGFGIAIVLCLFLVPRFFPIMVGKWHLRKHFDRLDKRTHTLNSVCLEALTRDALAYGKSVAARDRHEWEPRVYYWIEYERMLRIHAFASYVLLNGLDSEAVAKLEKDAIAAKLEKCELRGVAKDDLMELGRRYAARQMTNQAIEAHLLKNRVGAFDMDAQAAAADLVKSGRAWETQRTVLRAAGLLV